MSKGLLIYTACLCVGALAAFLLILPEHAILAGMAVLAATAAVLSKASSREFRQMEVVRERSRTE